MKAKYEAIDLIIPDHIVTILINICRFFRYQCNHGY